MKATLKLVAKGATCLFIAYIFQVAVELLFIKTYGYAPMVIMTNPTELVVRNYFMFMAELFWIIVMFTISFRVIYQRSHTKDRRVDFLSPFKPNLV